MALLNTAPMRSHARRALALLNTALLGSKQQEA
jgi:hypothetical protein